MIILQALVGFIYSAIKKQYANIITEKTNSLCNKGIVLAGKKEMYLELHFSAAAAALFCRGFPRETLCGVRLLNLLFLYSN